MTGLISGHRELVLNEYGMGARNREKKVGPCTSEEYGVEH
jgi:hypothetical protein